MLRQKAREIGPYVLREELQNWRGIELFVRVCHFTERFLLNKKEKHDIF
jgi:hypothetical protein